MTCYHPLTGHRQPDGKVKFTKHADSRSHRNAGDLQVTVPCGQCIGCRLSRSRVWATRCVHEAQFHKRNSFLTLTYDKEHLPDDGGLNVKHWQLFAKQVRNKIGDFRFYHCGEYGGDQLRPHYHACIFGLDFSEDREICEMSGDYPLYKSKQLQECWKYGYVWIGDFSFETAAYVARYCMAKLTGERAIEYGGLKPEYSTMSNRPGIGKAWYKKYGSQAHHMDSVFINGKDLPMPSYYDRLLEKDHPEVLERLKTARKEKAKLEDQSSARLKDREKCAEDGIGFKPRHSANIYIERRMRSGIGIPGRPIEDYY